MVIVVLIWPITSLNKHAIFFHKVGMVFYVSLQPLDFFDDRQDVICFGVLHGMSCGYNNSECEQVLRAN